MDLITAYDYDQADKPNAKLKISVIRDYDVIRSLGLDIETKKSLGKDGIKEFSRDYIIGGKNIEGKKIEVEFTNIVNTAGILERSVKIIKILD